ncbi:hypothetical protein [Aeromonas salmonicida]|uniref:hypothetical protein n=1 Tax=Aeromonas salmonicida TaxID=645 RepID=UPI00259FD8BE|nr:hypothetical protein [Aeromonas salmonicida]MDM5103361.1 hypothetical protein [Aeromonas salmonicida]
MSLLLPRYKPGTPRHQSTPKKHGGLMAPASMHCRPVGLCRFDAFLDKAVLGRARQLLVSGRLLALSRLVGGSAGFHALLDKAVFGGASQLLVEIRTPIFLSQPPLSWLFLPSQKLTKKKG